MLFVLANIHNFRETNARLPFFFAKFVDIILPTDLFIMESLKGKT